MKKIKWLFTQPFIFLWTYFVKILKGVRCWTLELFFVRVFNGKQIHWKESSTKLFRTIFMLLTVAMVFLIIYVFWYKLFGSDELLRKEITPELMKVYLGLGGILTILTTMLQWLYSKQKVADVKNAKDHLDGGAKNLKNEVPGGSKEDVAGA